MKGRLESSSNYLAIYHEVYPCIYPGRLKNRCQDGIKQTRNELGEILEVRWARYWVRLREVTTIQV